MLSRAELQELAQTRLDDARVLLQQQRYSAAYYLSGYVLELGFKAAIAKLFMHNVIPDRQLVNNLYTHDLEKLANLSGLKGELEAQSKRDQAFRENWSVVLQWSEASRYVTIQQAQAEELLSAVSDANSGVFSWLMLVW